jgi:hypothetical protein
MPFTLVPNFTSNGEPVSAEQASIIEKQLNAVVTGFDTSTIAQGVKQQSSDFDKMVADSNIVTAKKIPPKPSSKS